MENVLYLELLEMLTSFSNLEHKTRNFKQLAKITTHKTSSNLCAIILKNNSLLF